MIVGITGHRVLAQPGVWPWVRQALTKLLSSFPAPLVGVTSLACGADQLFAEVVLELGGTIETVIPFVDYEGTFSAEADLRNYRRLRDTATKVEVLGPYQSQDEAYLRAGQRVVDLSEQVVAVWDGEEAHGLGGTKDVVDYALFMHKPLVQFNPLTCEIVHWGECK